MRLRPLLSPRAGSTTARPQFALFNPPSTGSAEAAALAAELDDHIRSMGWRLIR